MKQKIFYILSATVLGFGCSGDSKFPEMEMTESGLYYKITSENEEAKMVMVDDIITIDLSYQSDDSMLFDSKTYEFPTQLRVVESAYMGDVMEGFIMMRVGDEGVFKTSADSFFKKIANIEVPSFIDTGSYLTFNVKVLKSQSMEELQAEKQAEADVSRNEEAGLIQQYLMENNITQEPKESGLYFIQTAPGDGKSVPRGSKVKVHYLGRLLTGEKFDSSYDRGEPIEFAIGSGQVIPGWDEGIGYMSAGGKATLVIPSHLAYGDRPPPGGIIKAFSPLVFDVELISVSK